MLNTVFSIYSLLLAIGILLMGSALLGTLLSLRASTEGFSNTVIGIVMSSRVKSESSSLPHVSAAGASGPVSGRKSQRSIQRYQL